MTLEEFEDALDSYGCHLSDWPPALAASGRVLLEQSAAAHRLMREAEEMDGGLSSLMAGPVRAPSGLAGRIVSGALAESDARIIAFPGPERAALQPGPPSRSYTLRRSSAFAAAAMVVCFLGGMLSVRTLFPEETDLQSSYYVSTIYGDLAR